MNKMQEIIAFPVIYKALVTELRRFKAPIPLSAFPEQVRDTLCEMARWGLVDIIGAKVSAGEPKNNPWGA